MTKPRKNSCSRRSITRGSTTKKQKLHLSKEKEYCFLLQPKADQQGSKKPLRDFRWIGPSLVEKILPDNNHIVRKLNTNKTQIPQRIRLRKYNPEKLPADNYQETQWQNDDNIVTPQDDLYTLAWEAEFGGHLFDIPIIYTDPNGIDFDESYTQGADTVIVPRSYFHTSDGQNRENCPTSDPSVVDLLRPKPHCRNQDVETSTNLGHKDSSKQTSESNKGIETAYELMQQPPSRQSDDASLLEINDPTTEIIPPNDPSHSRSGQYNICHNPNPKYSEAYRY